MGTDKPRDTKLVVKMLPVIIASADLFAARAAADVQYSDLLEQSEALIAGVDLFAQDEFVAVDPTLIAGARQFEQTGHPGFVAMGRYMMLQLLADHPEIMRLAAERARDALWDALCDDATQELARNAIG